MRLVEPGSSPMSSFERRCQRYPVKVNRQHLGGVDPCPRLGTRAIAALEVPELRAFVRDLREQRAASTVRDVYYTFCTRCTRDR